MRQTICIDSIECPYCGAKFDGGNSTDYDTSVNYTVCPECGKYMRIAQSVEYTATEETE